MTRSLGGFAFTLCKRLRPDAINASATNQTHQRLPCSR